MKKNISTVTFKQTKAKEEKLMNVISKYKDKEGSMLQILHETQEIYSYLPYEVMQIIAKELNVSIEKVYGVATFYAQFRLQPIGKYLIMLCQGTACHVNGSETVADAVGRRGENAVADRRRAGIVKRAVGICRIAGKDAV